MAWTCDLIVNYIGLLLNYPISSNQIWLMWMHTALILTGNRWHLANKHIFHCRLYIVCRALLFSSFCIFSIDENGNCSRQQTTSHFNGAGIWDNNTKIISQIDLICSCISRIENKSNTIGNNVNFMLLVWSFGLFSGGGDDDDDDGYAW